MILKKEVNLVVKRKKDAKEFMIIVNSVLMNHSRNSTTYDLYAKEGTEQFTVNFYNLTDKYFVSDEVYQAIINAMEMVSIHFKESKCK